MRKYDVLLALAASGSDLKLSLARMIFDMMELDELYQPLEYNETFKELGRLDEVECYRVLGIYPLSEERLKNLEKELVLDEEDEGFIRLKNYDVALAKATAGNIDEARRAIETANPKKILTISDFKTKTLHDRLFRKLIERNLPDPETPREGKNYFREIVVGWKRLGIEPREYEKRAERASKGLSEEGRTLFEKQVKLGLIDRCWFNKIMRRKLSNIYGFLRPSQLKFIDCVVCDAKNVAWIIEGKEKLNYEAIGQVIVLSDLFIEDNQGFSEVKKAIACKETDPVLEATCKKNEIQVLTLENLFM